MNIGILQNELDELRENPALFADNDFKACKEALDFVDLIEKFRPKDNEDVLHLQKQARILGDRLREFNRVIARKFYSRLKKGYPVHEELRTWFQPYTAYLTQEWGNPHYGYEDLDFLLDEILLPQPHPYASLPPEYGMVRYEPTPASVVLEMTERVMLSDEDVFYDLGSGLGKVTMLVHLLSGAHCIGVEYQPDFCTYAREQAHALNLSGVTYLNADARHADYADGTVFFLFNPFGGIIFDTVLEKLHKEAQKREIRICSYGSSSQPLSELSWLEYIPPISKEELALAVFRGRD